MSACCMLLGLFLFTDSFAGSKSKNYSFNCSAHTSGTKVSIVLNNASICTQTAPGALRESDTALNDTENEWNKMQADLNVDAGEKNAQFKKYLNDSKKKANELVIKLGDAEGKLKTHIEKARNAKSSYADLQAQKSKTLKSILESRRQLQEKRERGKKINNQYWVAYLKRTEKLLAAHNKSIDKFSKEIGELQKAIPEQAAVAKTLEEKSNVLATARGKYRDFVLKAENDRFNKRNWQQFNEAKTANTASLATTAPKSTPELTSATSNNPTQTAALAENQEREPAEPKSQSEPEPEPKNFAANISSKNSKAHKVRATTGYGTTAGETANKQNDANDTPKGRKLTEEETAYAKKLAGSDPVVLEHLKYQIEKGDRQVPQEIAEPQNPDQQQITAGEQVSTPVPLTNPETETVAVALGQKVNITSPAANNPETAGPDANEEANPKNSQPSSSVAEAFASAPSPTTGGNTDKSAASQLAPTTQTEKTGASENVHKPHQEQPPENARQALDARLPLPPEKKMETAPPALVPGTLAQNEIPPNQKEQEVLQEVEAGGANQPQLNTTAKLDRQPSNASPVAVPNDDAVKNQSLAQKTLGETSKRINELSKETKAFQASPNKQADLDRRLAYAAYRRDKMQEEVKQKEFDSEQDAIDYITARTNVIRSDTCLTAVEENICNTEVVSKILPIAEGKVGVGPIPFFPSYFNGIDSVENKETGEKKFKVTKNFFESSSTVLDRVGEEHKGSVARRIESRNKKAVENPLDHLPWNKEQETRPSEEVFQEIINNENSFVHQSRFDRASEELNKILDKEAKKVESLQAPSTVTAQAYDQALGFVSSNLFGGEYSTWQERQTFYNYENIMSDVATRDGQEDTFENIRISAENETFLANTTTTTATTLAAFSIMAPTAIPATLSTGATILSRGAAYTSRASTIMGRTGTQTGLRLLAKDSADFSSKWLYANSRVLNSGAKSINNTVKSFQGKYSPIVDGADIALVPHVIGIANNSVDQAEAKLFVDTKSEEEALFGKTNYALNSAKNSRNLAYVGSGVLTAAVAPSAIRSTVKYAGKGYTAVKNSKTLRAVGSAIETSATMTVETAKQAGRAVRDSAPVVVATTAISDAAVASGRVARQAGSKAAEIGRSADAALNNVQAYKTSKQAVIKSAKTNYVRSRNLKKEGAKVAQQTKIVAIKAKDKVVENTSSFVNSAYIHSEKAIETIAKGAQRLIHPVLDAMRTFRVAKLVSTVKNGIDRTMNISNTAATATKKSKKNAKNSQQSERELAHAAGHGHHNASANQGIATNSAVKNAPLEKSILAAKRDVSPANNAPVATLKPITGQTQKAELARSAKLNTAKVEPSKISNSVNKPTIAMASTPARFGALSRNTRSAFSRSASPSSSSLSQRSISASASANFPRISPVVYKTAAGSAAVGTSGFFVSAAAANSFGHSPANNFQTNDRNFNDVDYSDLEGKNANNFQFEKPEINKRALVAVNSDNTAMGFPNKLTHEQQITKQENLNNIRTHLENSHRLRMLADETAANLQKELGIPVKTVSSLADDQIQMQLMYDGKHYEIRLGDKNPSHSDDIADPAKQKDEKSISTDSGGLDEAIDSIQAKLAVKDYIINKLKENGKETEKSPLLSNILKKIDLEINLVNHIKQLHQQDSDINHIASSSSFTDATAAESSLFKEFFEADTIILDQENWQDLKQRDQEKQFENKTYLVLVQDEDEDEDENKENETGESNEKITSSFENHDKLTHAEVKNKPENEGSLAGLRFIVHKSYEAESNQTIYLSDIHLADFTHFSVALNDENKSKIGHQICDFLGIDKSQIHGTHSPMTLVLDRQLASKTNVMPAAAIPADSSLNTKNPPIVPNENLQNRSWIELILSYFESAFKFAYAKFFT